MSTHSPSSDPRADSRLWRWGLAGALLWTAGCAGGKWFSGGTGFSGSTEYHDLEQQRRSRPDVYEIQRSQQERDREEQLRRERRAE